MDHELIGEGRRAEILAWDDGRVLKLYRDASAIGAATEEARATAAAHSAGAPAPRCFGTAEFDGRTGVRAHGGPMPVYGRIFSAEAADHGTYSAVMEARGRILSIAYYLESLQN